MLLLISYSIAVAAFLLPMRFSNPMAVCCSFVLSATWAAAAIFAFAKGEHRSAQVMLGLPLVLFWPALYVIATATCWYGSDRL